MKNENSFEIKNIDLEKMNEIVEIKDDELKMVTGGGKTGPLGGDHGGNPNNPTCRLH